MFASGPENSRFFPESLFTRTTSQTFNNIKKGGQSFNATRNQSRNKAIVTIAPVRSHIIIAGGVIRTGGKVAGAFIKIYRKNRIRIG